MPVLRKGRGVIWGLVATILAVLSYAVAMTVLVVRAKDALRKSQGALKNSIAAGEKTAQMLEDAAAATQREKAARAALRRRLREAEELVASCTDPTVLASALNTFFSEEKP